MGLQIAQNGFFELVPFADAPWIARDTHDLRGMKANAAPLLAFWTAEIALDPKVSIPMCHASDSYNLGGRLRAQVFGTPRPD
jgi:hypothetical protein